MRVTGAARNRAGQCRRVDDLPSLGRVVIDVLVGACREKARERMHNRKQSLQRHAASRGHHMLLGDAALDESIRQFRLESFDAAVRQKIGVHHDDLGPGARDLQQLITVGDHKALGPGRRHARRKRRVVQCKRRLLQRCEPRVHAGGNLVDGGEIVVQARCARMEVIRRVAAREPFHERHALAFHGVGNEDLRAIGHARELLECPANRAQVVSVSPLHFPAERTELVLDRAEIADGRHGSIRLQLVVIDDDGDFGELLVGGRLQGFPDLAFLQLAVAGHHDNPSAASGQAFRAGHAVRFRDPHAERAGVGRDKRRGDVRMSGQAAEPPQLVQEIEVEFLECDEQCVQRGRVVPLRREVHIGIRRAAVGIDKRRRPQPADQIQ